MRLVFAGTPDVALAALDALHASDHEIAAVVTRADAPLGRKRILTPSPVAARADALGLRVIKANRLDDSVSDEIAALRPDLGVIVAYGGLVRQRLLAVPPAGWINLHFSVLPRWRGAAPVQRAILNGDAVTGAAVFRLVRELDAGDVYATVSRPIGVTDTAGDLLAALADEGAKLLSSVVDDIAAGTAVAVPQSGEPTAAPKLDTDDARLRWHEPVESVSARQRAVTPEPGAFTVVDGVRLKIIVARPADSAVSLPPGRISEVGGSILAGTATAPLELITVQPAGKKPMTAADWWRGAVPHAEHADGGAAAFLRVDDEPKAAAGTRAGAETAAGAGSAARSDEVAP